MLYEGFVIQYRTEDGLEHMVVSDDINLLAKLDMIFSQSGIFSVLVKPHTTKIDAILALSR